MKRKDRHSSNNKKERPRNLKNFMIIQAAIVINNRNLRAKKNHSQSYNQATMSSPNIGTNKTKAIVMMISVSL